MSHSEAASSPGGKLPMHAAMDSDTIASVSSLSPLELSRLQWKPTLPNVLRGDIRLQHGQERQHTEEGTGERGGSRWDQADGGVKSFTARTVSASLASPHVPFRHCVCLALFR